MSSHRAIILFGTRPEIIKLAPLIKILKNYPIEVDICFSGQHPDMVEPLLKFFNISPNINLELRRASSSLSDLTKELLDKLSSVYNYINYDLTIVQGDTTSSFVGSLVSFYHKVPVAHIEAGLRSGNKNSPFPEEMNRLLITRLSDLHFAPTESNAQNLKKEGIEDNVWITGNTVIDALFLTLEILEERNDLKEKILNRHPVLKEGKRIVLITAHRRENWGDPLKNIALAVKKLALQFEDYNFVIPMHKNPEVRKVWESELANYPNIYLLEPFDYPELVFFLSQSYLVLTDSGGIQEEAPSLGKPVLVLRENTERQEGIKEGVAFLVGTDPEKIIKMAKSFFENPDLYKSVAIKKNPYGDGKASERISRIIYEYLKNNASS